MIKNEIEVQSSYDGEDIEITVRIDHYSLIRPNSRADNPDDFYGYEEMEYTVLYVRNIETNEELPATVLDDQDKEFIANAIRSQYV